MFLSLIKKKKHTKQNRNQLLKVLSTWISVMTIAFIGRIYYISLKAFRHRWLGTKILSSASYRNSEQANIYTEWINKIITSVWMSSPVHWLNFLLICLYIQYARCTYNEQYASIGADYLAHFNGNSFSLPPYLCSAPRGPSRRSKSLVAMLQCLPSEIAVSLHFISTSLMTTLNRF